MLADLHQEQDASAASDRATGSAAAQPQPNHVAESMTHQDVSADLPAKAAAIAIGYQILDCQSTGDTQRRSIQHQHPAASMRQEDVDMADPNPAIIVLPCTK